jgi:hypothetical protein
LPWPLYGFTWASSASGFALPFGGLWYLNATDAIDYAKHSSRAHDAVIRVYGAAGNVIEMWEPNRAEIFSPVDQGVDKEFGVDLANAHFDLHAVQLARNSDLAFS